MHTLCAVHERRHGSGLIRGELAGRREGPIQLTVKLEEELLATKRSNDAQPHGCGQRAAHGAEEENLSRVVEFESSELQRGTHRNSDVPERELLSKGCNNWVIKCRFGREQERLSLRTTRAIRHVLAEKYIGGAVVVFRFALMRVIRSRPRRVDSTLVVWGVATAVQLGTILVERPKRNIGSPSGGPLLSRFDHRVLFTNLLPKQIAGSFLAPVAVLIGAALVLFAAWRAWQRPRHAKATLLVLVPAIGLAFWIFAGTHYGLPARYRVFPALCVIWCVLVAWEELMRAVTSNVAVDWRAASVLVVVLALVWLTYWTPAASRSSGPKWTVALTKAEKRCKNLKLPTVALRVPPVAKGAGVWTVRLPCSDVT